jgi:hypothetical protein
MNPIQRFDRVRYRGDEYWAAPFGNAVRLYNNRSLRGSPVHTPATASVVRIASPPPSPPPSPYRPPTPRTVMTRLMQEIDDLKEEKDGLERRAASTEQQLTTSEQARAAAERHAASAEQQLTTSEQARAAAERRATSAEKQLAEARASHLAVERRLNASEHVRAAAERRATSAEDQLIEARAGRLTAERRLNASEQAREAAESRATVAEQLAAARAGQLSASEQARASAVNQANAIREVQQENATLKRETTKLEQEKSTLDSQLSDVTKKLEAAATAALSAAQERENTREEVAKLEREKSKLEQEKTTLDSQLTLAKRQVSDMKRDRDAATTAAVSAAHEREELMVQLRNEKKPAALDIQRKEPTTAGATTSIHEKKPVAIDLQRKESITTAATTPPNPTIAPVPGAVNDSDILRADVSDSSAVVVAPTVASHEAVEPTDDAVLFEAVKASIVDNLLPSLREAQEYKTQELVNPLEMSVESAQRLARAGNFSKAVDCIRAARDKAIQKRAGVKRVTTQLRECDPSLLGSVVRIAERLFELYQKPSNVLTVLGQSQSEAGMLATHVQEFKDNDLLNAYNEWNGVVAALKRLTVESDRGLVEALGRCDGFLKLIGEEMVAFETIANRVPNDGHIAGYLARVQAYVFPTSEATKMRTHFDTMQSNMKKLRTSLESLKSVVQLKK